MPLLAHVEPAPPLAPELTERLARRVSARPHAERLTVGVLGAGMPIAELPRSSQRDVSDAVQSARPAQRRWAGLPLLEWAAILQRFHDLVLQRQRQAMDLIQAESGTSCTEAFGQAATLAMTAHRHAQRIRSHTQPALRAVWLPGAAYAITRCHPVEVVGIIGSPHRSPVPALDDVLPVLLAGQAVVQIPNPHTTLITLWSLDLLIEVGLPEGLWQVVLGPASDLSAALTDHADRVMVPDQTY